MELGRQPTTRRVLVAGRAIDTGTDVISILAGCFGAIVTACAHGCCTKTCMIHPGRWQPGHRLMAGITRSLRHGMRGRLAGCRAAVMASETGTGDHTRMIKFGTRKDLGAVARVATQCSDEVLLRLDHIVPCQAQTTGMTAGAVARRTFENSSHMT